MPASLDSLKRVVLICKIRQSSIQKSPICISYIRKRKTSEPATIHQHDTSLLQQHRSFNAPIHTTSIVDHTKQQSRHSQLNNEAEAFCLGFYHVGFHAIVDINAMEID